MRSQEYLICIAQGAEECLSQARLGGEGRVECKDRLGSKLRRHTSKVWGCGSIFSPTNDLVWGVVSAGRGSSMAGC